MPYATWLPDVLSDAGLVVRPYPGWETRGKSDFAPRGHMLHHTVTKPTTPDLTIDKFLAVTGTTKVPPPLANISTNRDGSVSVIAAGTANHGGAGVWKGISGNRFWIGDEMKNLGSGLPTSVWYEPWVPGQVEAALRAAAACLEHIGADTSWLVGHKEYATPAGRKVDPHTLNMNTLRATAKTLNQEDTMNAEQEAKLDAVLAAVDRVPGRVWATPISTGDYTRSTYQALFRTEQATQRIEAGQDNLDEAELAAMILAGLPAEAIADAIEAGPLVDAVREELNRRLDN